MFRLESPRVVVNLSQRKLVGVPKAEIAKAGSVKPDQSNICVGNKKESLA